MKTKTVALLTANFTFSLLFYAQSIGINFILFALLINCLLAALNPSLLLNKKWWWATILNLYSSTFTFIYAENINLVISILTMLILTGVSFNTKASFITAPLVAGFSVITNVFIGLVEKIEKHVSLPAAHEKNQKSTLQWHQFVLPIFITLMFVIIYKNASANFNYATNQIDLSFISPGWLLFCLFGFYFCYGLLWPNKAFEILVFDKNISITNKFKFKWITIGFFNTGILLFSLLNLLLFIVNITDLIYIFGYNENNMLISYSTLIHQGINSLFLSLTLAIIFILVWCNRTDKNEKHQKTLHRLAYVWIFLNLILVFTNVYKNYLYVSIYGLTNLRIGVYFILLLAALMLIFCYVKIKFDFNNWFLFKRMGETIAAILCLYQFFNWDTVIAEQNIGLYKNENKTPDTAYLLSLSDNVIPLLTDNWQTLNPNHYSFLNHQLKLKINNFLQKHDYAGWPSYSIKGDETFKAIKQIDWEKLY